MTSTSSHPCVHKLTVDQSTDRKVRWYSAKSHGPNCCWPENVNDMTVNISQVIVSNREWKGHQVLSVFSFFLAYRYFFTSNPVGKVTLTVSYLPGPGSFSFTAWQSQSNRREYLGNVPLSGKNQSGNIAVTSNTVVVFYSEHTFAIIQLTLIIR